MFINDKSLRNRNSTTQHCHNILSIKYCFDFKIINEIAMKTTDIHYFNL